MIKRISCNVINSRPLRNTNMAPAPINRLSGAGHESVYNALPNISSEHITNPGKIYRIIHSALKIANYQTGQIFDYTA